MLLLLLFVGCTTAAHITGNQVSGRAADLIVNLPGLANEPSFAQYSGYLEGLSANYQLNYWFSEAKESKETAPFILWLNGGPGCSSLIGLLQENGPFRVASDSTLDYNPHSWNNVSLNSYHALLNFLKKFPEYHDRDFYISGESYAGVYVPTLASRVAADEANGLNLKGIAVGNPLVDYDIDDDSLMYFLYYHGYVDPRKWDSAIETCCGTPCLARCRFTQSDNPRCKALTAEITVIIHTIGYYNMYSRCTDLGYTRSTQEKRKRPISSQHKRLTKSADTRRMLSLNTQSKTKQYRKFDRYTAAPKIPCELDKWMEAYLNRDDVREALHITNDSASQWMSCNDDVFNTYGRTYTNLENQYVGLLDSGVEVLLYAGDIDLAVNVLGLQWFINELPVEKVEKLKPWYYTDEDGTIQVGGMYQRSLRGNNTLQYATVRGSGHFIPTDRPVASYEMITKFVWGVSGITGV